MKKIIKKIILVISLVAVLVSSMVLPSLAYQYSGGGFSTWYSFMGDTDLLMFPMIWDTSDRFTDFDNSLTTYFRKYVSYPEPNDYGRLVFDFDPAYFSNAGKFNGALSVRLGGDPYSNTYTYDFGFFDLTDDKRNMTSSTVDGRITVQMYKLDFLLSYRNDFGSLPDYAYHLTDFFDALFCDIYPSDALNDRFLFCIEYPKQLETSLFPDDNLSLVLFPNIKTSDDIYRYYKTLYDLTEQDYQDMYAAYKPLEDENATLKTDIETLEGDIASKDALIAEKDDLIEGLDKWVGEQLVEISDLTKSNQTLTEQNDSLSKQISELQLSVKNNSSLNGLFNGIGQGFSSILDSISGLGVGGLTVGACIAVAVVIFVVFIIIKLILR